MTRSLGRASLWFCAVLLTAACGASAPGSAQSSTAVVARVGAESETAFLREGRTAELLLADGRKFAEKLGADGTFPDTVDGPKGALAVESLRRAYYVVAAGLISKDADRDDLLDRGIKAFEYGFSQAGPDGSFPNERGGTKKKQNSLHPKSEFIEASARTILLLQQSDLAPAYDRRVKALVPQLRKSALWLANSQDTVAFFGRAKNTNQLMFVASGLQQAGVVTGDRQLTDRARELMETILKRQTADGAFPEKGGYDTNYQTVSLELLARYAHALPQSPWRDQVMTALRKGSDRFLASVDPQTGVISDAANTRTMACGAAVSGSDPKGKDIDIVPLRLYYLGFLLNDEARLSRVADRIQETGQSFTHKEKCDGASGKKKGKRDKGGDSDPAD
jgi:hypothetical protein